MMVAYNPEEPLAILIEHLEKEIEFTWIGEQIITDAIMVSKGITFLKQNAIFNDEIIEWR